MLARVTQTTPSPEAQADVLMRNADFGDAALLAAMRSELVQRL